MAARITGCPNKLHPAYAYIRGDDMKLAEAITDLADDPVRMRTMGTSARRTATERYGEDEVVERYIRSMRSL